MTRYDCVLVYEFGGSLNSEGSFNNLSTSPDDAGVSIRLNFQATVIAFRPWANTQLHSNRLAYSRATRSYPRQTASRSDFVEEGFKPSRSVAWITSANKQMSTLYPRNKRSWWRNLAGGFETLPYGTPDHRTNFTLGLKQTSTFVCIVRRANATCLSVRDDPVEPPPRFSTLRNSWNQFATNDAISGVPN